MCEHRDINIYIYIHTLKGEDYDNNAKSRILVACPWKILKPWSTSRTKAHKLLFLVMEIKFPFPVFKYGNRIDKSHTILYSTFL